MTIKIKVTEERLCCKERDLVKYCGEKGHFSPSRQLRFCCHCGQLWVEESYTDAAGGRDTKWVKVHPGKIYE